MTDTILTDEQLHAIEAEQQRLAEIGDYPYGDGIHALVASHRALSAERDTLRNALYPFASRYHKAMDAVREKNSKPAPSRLYPVAFQHLETAANLVGQPDDDEPPPRLDANTDAQTLIARYEALIQEQANKTFSQDDAGYLIVVCIELGKMGYRLTDDESTWYLPDSSDDEPPIMTLDETRLG